MKAGGGFIEQMRRFFPEAVVLKTDAEHGNESVKIPRAALIASSPVFGAMFDHDTEELRTQTVVCEGFSSKVS